MLVRRSMALKAHSPADDGSDLSFLFQHLSARALETNAWIGRRPKTQRRADVSRLACPRLAV
jgi:hypothetical protein